MSVTRTASIGLLCLAVAACGRNSAGRQPDGVTRSANLAAYTYSYNNPVRLVAPDGRAHEDKWL